MDSTHIQTIISKIKLLKEELVTNLALDYSNTPAQTLAYSGVYGVQLVHVSITSFVA